jgi:hypothetical protein
MSKPYKMEIILSHLGNVDGNFKESLENVLANPLVQVFLKLDRIIDLASSVDFDSFRLFTTVAEETMRNYLEFHRKYFELTRALFSCLRKLKPASSSWQSWKSERRKLNELTERMRIYSYRDRR